MVNYKLPTLHARLNRSVKHPDTSVHINKCPLEEPGDFSGEAPCHGEAQLSSLTTPQRSRATSVDSGVSLVRVQSPDASLGAAMLIDDETEEEAEHRREQEQEQARRLYVANVDTCASMNAAQYAADGDEAREDKARKAEQMQMLALLKRHNLLDTLETRCDAEHRFQRRSGEAMFHSQAGDLCRDPRLEVLDSADFLRRRVSRF